MKVFKASADVPLGPQTFLGSIVTIGNFDGCHRGHQALIELTRKLSLEREIPSVVLTFDPNPKQFFQPHRKIGKLFNRDQKIRALSELGIDALVIRNFDLPFSQLSAEEFYSDLLREKLQARAIVVGHDFCFGAQRKGNLGVLRTLAEKDGIEVHEVSPQICEGTTVSSSSIRELLLERDIERVNRLLRRPYLLEGSVVAGKKLGRTLGFPTANLDCGEQLLPGIGVYAGFALLGRESPVFTITPDAIPCVLNIGLRPTVDLQGLEPMVEVHLLEGTYPPEGFYGRTLNVSLTDFIRNERKFASLDELKGQIGADCVVARERLALRRVQSR